ncbi:uncharacterized protein TNCV_3061971 [Trichonephila clavipes]|nr:uncharacterized protein TNCV_3061971 [Trichonephila clavipes]
MMTAFVLDAMPVNAAFQSALLNNEVALHLELWFGMRFILMDVPICYKLRQDNARSHVAKTIRDFCSAQHIQLLPCTAYSHDMLPIEHVWDFVGPPLARNPRLAAPKD